MFLVNAIFSPLFKEGLAGIHCGDKVPEVSSVSWIALVTRGVSGSKWSTQMLNGKFKPLPRRFMIAMRVLSGDQAGDRSSVSLAMVNLVTTFVSRFMT